MHNSCLFPLDTTAYGYKSDKRRRGLITSCSIVYYCLTQKKHLQGYYTLTYTLSLPTYLSEQSNYLQMITCLN